MRAQTSIIALALTLAAGHAHAGYYLKHEMKMPDASSMMPGMALPGKLGTKTTTVESWHEGKRFKRENPIRGETVIIDLDKKEVAGVNPKNKTFWKLPSERYQRLAMMSLMVMGVQMQPDGSVKVPDNLFQPTGKTAKVGRWTAYEVKVQSAMSDKMKTTFWLSEEVDIPIEKMINELKITLGDPKDKEFRKLFAQWRDLKGYPVRTTTVIETPRGAIETMETLVEYRKQKIDPNVFVVPKSYKKTQDPLSQFEGVFKSRMKQQQGGAAGGKKAKPLVKPAQPKK